MLQLLTQKWTQTDTNPVIDWADLSLYTQIAWYIFGVQSLIFLVLYLICFWQGTKEIRKDHKVTLFFFFFGFYFLVCCFIKNK